MHPFFHSFRSRSLPLVLLAACCLLPAAVTACQDGGTLAPTLPFDRMREGDLVFRCGEGIVSRAVLSVEEDGVYSHVGILVRDGDAWKVVHLAPDRARAGALVHCGLSDPAVLARIRETALGWARDNVPFDDDFDIADSSRLYCTELVWRLYRRAGIDLSEGRRRRLDILFVHGDCLLPGHLFQYSGKTVYYQFNTQSL